MNERPTELLSVKDQLTKLRNELVSQMHALRSNAEDYAKRSAKAEAEAAKHAKEIAAIDKALDSL